MIPADPDETYNLPSMLAQLKAGPPSDHLEDDQLAAELVRQIHMAESRPGETEGTQVRFETQLQDVERRLEAKIDEGFCALRDAMRELSGKCPLPFLFTPALPRC